MPLEISERFTRAQIRSRPSTLYAYAGNLAGTGLGGQAAEARYEPNAVEIPTKRYPGRQERDFFTDVDFDRVRGIIDDGFRQLHDHMRKGGDVVLPAAGFGSERAELAVRAPRIQRYIDKHVKRLHEVAVELAQNSPCDLDDAAAPLQSSLSP